jgi:small redox-active disulfide protein 2
LSHNQDIMSKEIKIIGSGCSRCSDTYEFVRATLEGMGADVRLSHQFGPEEKAKHNLEATPGIFVDGELKMFGKVPTVEEIKALLEN